MVPSTLKIAECKIEKFSLNEVPLEVAAAVLNERLKANFQKVQVEVTECPNLTLPPFTLACKGINGNAAVLELGGVPYLLPQPKREKIYDLRGIADLLNLDPCYVIGAGAGPWPYAGTNCEMIVNLGIKGSNVDNQTRMAKVNTTDGKCILEILPQNECRNAILSNLYCCSGETGKVLKIYCARRTGNDDFASSIRNIFADQFKDKFIGLGGVFLIKEGKARQHIMPDFSKTDIHSDAELNNWLKFYEMSAPLIAVGTIVNRDPGLDLRLQHFHSFSYHGEGGHYHNDTTPDQVEYLAYLNFGKTLYRIDRPEVTHQYGRD